jgi:transcription-repair coupling factor (superfamily II helicase)
MDWLKKALFDCPPFDALGEALRGGGRLSLQGLPGSLPAIVACFVAERAQRPVLVVGQSLEDAEELADDLTGLLPGRGPCLLPGLPHYGRSASRVELSEQAEVLLALRQHEAAVVVTSASALLDSMPSPDAVKQSLFELARGGEFPREALLEFLARGGYARESLVESVGQFAARGAVVDVFSYGAAKPVRVEYYDDIVDSLRTFDPATQMSNGAVERCEVFAAKSAETQASPIFEHLPEKAVILWVEGNACWNALREEWQTRNPTPPYPPASRGEGASPPVHGGTEGGSQSKVTPDSLRLKANDFLQLFVNSSPFGVDQRLSFGALPQETFAANLPLLAERLREYHDHGLRSVILSDSKDAGQRLVEILEERGCPEDILEAYEGGLHHGFTLPSAKLAVLVDHDIFGRRRRRRRFMKFKNVVPLRGLDALQVGDFVVHIDYGIGRYLGLEKIAVLGVSRERLKIEYKDGVLLYVKLENLAQIQKYAGREGFQPPLSRIGGRDWMELRRRTKQSLKSIAEQLIQLYAKRKTAPGLAMSADTTWQREMEAAFPYEDTPDQLQAAEEVKRDMEKPLPMDRLVCGDVGYGKTEVAMRASFKAVMDGKQVAILVPTTVLAQQHYRTFRERFKTWPMQVEVVSRFRTPKEANRILQLTAEGQVDVLIGTHRLLSKDVKFKDLGLLIIDEEHRFGVVQKEKLKSLKTNVDVLTLSATPIPRTLHMALMGARDMSHITTPPPGRLPIETDIVPWSETVIRDAILYELQREGQVFFIHNRIQSIESIYRLLRRLLPSVRFGVAHGQMPESKLSRVMVDFLEGRYDVLISTMIVESGLDMPNVNTMIVNRADRFGLAQLYQLRGRIGRSSRKAYAYFLVPPRFEMTRTAAQRLSTLASFDSLGAGFQVAMRDLEIRGAGNLLGREQSGYINAVGFELYQRLIEEAVEEVRLEGAGESVPTEPKEKHELKLEFPMDAFLPEDYMPEGGQRLNFYRELVHAKELSRIGELETEVRDRFGRFPPPAQTLFAMARMRLWGEHLGAARIAMQDGRLSVEFPMNGENGQDVKSLALRIRDYPVEFSAYDQLVVSLRLPIHLPQEELLNYLVGFVRDLAEAPVMSSGEVN